MASEGLTTGEYIQHHLTNLTYGQLPDGGWNIYDGGPSEINACVKAYFALKLAGDVVVINTLDGGDRLFSRALAQLGLGTRTLNALERESPGTKASFYLGFLDRMAPLLVGHSAAALDELNACTTCGSPTTGDVCAFCRLVERAHAIDPVAVDVVLSGRNRR